MSKRTSHLRTNYSNNMSFKNTLCTKFIATNTSLFLDDCTFATSCEKCEVATTSHQKMSLQAANFRPCPNTCYGMNMAQLFTQGEGHTTLTRIQWGRICSAPFCYISIIICLLPSSHVTLDKPQQCTHNAKKKKQT
jgi:hypothetical protein